MPRKKAPKAKIKKAEKDALKAAKDHGEAFLAAFTATPDAKWPGARG
jgi:hypothetical protein